MVAFREVCFEIEMKNIIDAFDGIEIEFGPGNTVGNSLGEQRIVDIEVMVVEWG